MVQSTEGVEWEGYGVSHPQPTRESGGASKMDFLAVSLRQDGFLVRFVASNAIAWYSFLLYLRVKFEFNFKFHYFAHL